MENRITRLFGIKYPIVQGGMVWCSGWRLAAAVSNQGGLGLLGAGSMHPEVLVEHIHNMQEATRQPWGINVPLLYPEIEKVMDIINVLSRQFKKAGVEMNIALVTRFDWKAGYNGYLAGFAAEFDPDGVFKSFVTGASDNNMAYSSPKVDELLREGRATEDPAKRKAAYQAFEVAYAAMPAQLPLVYLHGNYVSVAGLKGLDTTRVLGHHAVGVMWNIEDWTLQR